MRATSNRDEPVTAVGTQAGFWCECLLARTESNSTVLVGSFDAPTARDAVRWIRIAVRMLVSLADEVEAEPVHEWLLFGSRPTAAALECGKPFAVTLRHEQVQLTWSARPVRFLPLAHRFGHALPSCALEWAQPAALRAALTASENTAPSASR
ncbi:hypothetical protein ACWD4G_14325 [Streptomyces sp. NPDC002643]